MRLARLAIVTCVALLTATGFARAAEPQRPAVGAAPASVPCNQMGGYPWVQGGCINAVDLNNAINESVSASPPQNNNRTGASFGKFWIDTSTGASTPSLRQCVSLTGCGATYVSTDWLNWGTYNATAQTFAFSGAVQPVGFTATAPLAISGSTISLNYGGEFAAPGAALHIATGGVTNAMLAGNITASKLVGTDINTVGTLTAGATGAGFTVALDTSTITGTLAASRLPAFTGDISTSAGSSATTLATVNNAPGSFGSATQVGTFTVNGKGLVTAAANVTVTPAIGSVTGLGAGVASLLGGASTGTGGPVGSTSPTVAGITVTGSLTATGLVTNADLANPATTVNGQTCTLGSSCTVTAAATSMASGTTTVTGGTSGRVLYDNAGVLGEYAITGAAGSVVMSSGPTIATLTVTGAFTATGLVTNADLAGSIAASKLVGTDIGTVGTLTAGATGAGFTIALSASTVTGVLPSTRGGAGTVSGLMKADGAGVVSQAISGTDYAPPSTGSALQLGSGAGGLAGYAGFSATTNQFVTAISANGTPTKAQPATTNLSDIDTFNLNTSGTAGAASFSPTSATPPSVGLYYPNGAVTVGSGSANVAPAGNSSTLGLYENGTLVSAWGPPAYVLDVSIANGSYNCPTCFMRGIGNWQIYQDTLQQISYNDQIQPSNGLVDMVRVNSGYVAGEVVGARFRSGAKPSGYGSGSTTSGTGIDVTVSCTLSGSGGSWTCTGVAGAITGTSAANAGANYLNTALSANATLNNAGLYADPNEVSGTNGFPYLISWRLLAGGALTLTDASTSASGTVSFPNAAVNQLDGFKGYMSYRNAPPAASFTASLSGTTLTVSAIASGAVSVGESFVQGGVSYHVVSGTSGTGSYTVSPSGTFSSTTLTAYRTPQGGATAGAIGDIVDSWAASGATSLVPAGGIGLSHVATFLAKDAAGGGDTSTGGGYNTGVMQFNTGCPNAGTASVCARMLLGLGLSLYDNSGNAIPNGQGIYTAPATIGGFFLGAMSSNLPSANGTGGLYADTSNGLDLIGQGSGSDVSIRNKNGTVACSLATGTTTFNCTNLSVTTNLNIVSGLLEFASTYTLQMSGSTFAFSNPISVAGATSGSLILKTAAVAGSNTLTFPAGTTDFTSTGGTSQFVKQASAGAALTVAQPAFSDLSGSAACSQLPALTGNVTTTAGTCSNTIAAGVVANSMLVNASTTVNGQTCTLGSTCTITAAATGATIGTTTISGGTTGYLLYNNAGVLGNETIASVLTQGSGISITGTTNATIAVASGGVTNAMLTNSTITLGATAISLGGSVTAANLRGPNYANIDEVTLHGDSAYAIAAADRTVGLNANLTAARVWTLPAANAVNAGQDVTVSPLTGTVTASNTLSVARAGSDTINGGASSVVFSSSNESVTLRSDGVSNWQVVSRQQTAAAVSNKWLSAWSPLTGYSQAQPDFSNLSGSATCAQLPPLTGNVTTGGGVCSTTIAAGVVTNAMLAGSIAASKLVGTDIATVGTITSGTWNGTAIANAYLVNSTISGVALGGTLAALTATDSTLTFSGSYTGTTARTVGLNLGNANTWTAAQTFNDGKLVLNGATSGTLTLKAAAVAGTSSVLTLPGGTTDFSATGGASKFVKQASAGAVLTVVQPSSADLSDVTATANWTPVDNSGASLTLTVANAKAYVVGKAVSILFDIAYPVTISSAQASVGGLPVTVLASGTNTQGCALTLNSAIASIDRFLFINGQSVFDFDNISASFATNAQLSTGTVRGSCVYISAQLIGGVDDTLFAAANDNDGFLLRRVA